MKSRIAIAFALLIAAQSAFAKSQVASDSDIRKILADRIDLQRQGVGIVVGVIEPSGRRVVSYGGLDIDDKRSLNGDTVFEIGSVTKVFTSLLLADAVSRGELALTDPVSKYLPREVKVPERGGKKITLLDLATHTSALPRLPSNLTPADPANPYADYTVQQMHDFLSSYELPRDIGSQYEYSNFGVGLLGHVLALRAGMDYETLVRTRILDPLGMKSTSITLADEMKPRLAVGHDEERKRAANWDLPSLAGAGALRSTANDLLRFLAAVLSYEKSPLAESMAAQLATRRPTPAKDLQIALGWHVKSTNGHDTAWHGGGTGGYRSFLGFDPKKRVGVVVLSNMSTMNGVDDIGVHLLDPSVPVAMARNENALDAKVLEGYAGRYEVQPNFVLTVTNEGNRLFAQATGQPRFEIFAENDRHFFYKVVNAQITFQVDGKGRATGLVLHQNGAHMPAKRIGDAPAPKVRKEIAIDAGILDRYVGRYQLAPAFVIAITREGDQLMAQATGQPKFPIFAESERDFFFKVVDAQLTFQVDANGRATAVVLHQNDLDQKAKRIE